MTNYKELANALDKYDEDDKQRDEIAAILRGLDAQPVAEVSVMGSYHGKPILGCVLSNDSMQVGDKLFAAPVAAQPPSHSVIAGALFDFMGWLTTRKERLCLSSADDASPAVTAITEWAIGIYAGIHSLGETQRHMVNNADGSTIRPNGFRKCHPIRKDVGRWLLTVAADELERSKPGTVNLWTMLTPAAFDLELDTE